MCAHELRFDSLEEKADNIEAVWLAIYKASTTAEMFMFLTRKSLQEDVEPQRKLLSRKKFLDWIKSIRQLSPGQLSNYLNLVELYGEKPDWYDCAALVSKKNGKSSYRTVISKNFSAHTRNSRGNNAFSKLIEKRFFEVKRKKRISTSTFTYFVRKCAMYRPKGFFQTYCEIFHMWMSAITGIENHFNVRHSKLEFDVLSQQTRDKLQMKEALSVKTQSKSLRHVLLKPTQALTELVISNVKAEQASLDSQIARFKKYSDAIKTIAPRELATRIYASDLRYSELVKAIRITSSNLTKILDYNFEYSRKMNEGMKKEIMQRFVRLLLMPDELDKFFITLQNQGKTSN